MTDLEKLEQLLEDFKLESQTLRDEYANEILVQIFDTIATHHVFLSFNLDGEFKEFEVMQ